MVDGERAVDARLAMVHVPSHSRQRHMVATVIVLASVSIRLPWQNGQAVGRLTASLIRDSDIIGVFHLVVITACRTVHLCTREQTAPAVIADSVHQ
jgi:hypothetical protein